MMRKKTKMAWSVALSAAMAAGLLAGCGSNGGTESTSGSTAASSAKTESSASDTTDTSDRPTYKIATVRWTDTWPTDFLHEGVMKEIEDKMNINIDWQVYYNSDWSEQKSLLLASGDLPDAFLGSICLTQADMAQNKSAFLDLTDLIEKDMPNLKAAFEADPELKAVCTSRDGRIYSLPKKLPLRPKVCGDVMCINQEWLDNLGLETPKTYKELEEDLENHRVAEAVIHQNQQTPTGQLIAVLMNGKSKDMYIDDVKEVRQMLEDANVSYQMTDVPKESKLLSVGVPIASLGVMVILLFMLMGRNAGSGGGGSKMMNFGKSRAQLTQPSGKRFTFRDVAGLQEEKEDLKEIVDFLKARINITK